MYYRQGEVVVERTGELPEGMTFPKETKHHTLSVGSSSTHRHVLRGGIVEGNTLYLQAPTDLVVEGDGSRHEPITLEKGAYTFRIRREYVPGDVPRNVED